jgi:transposase-like protein/DNA-directed RNA polymerase subunit RPC12/RpoP
MIQTDLSSFSYKKGSLVPVCKRCGKENFYKDGKNKKSIQRYECRACGFRFVWTSDLPRRKNFSSIMGFAIETYTSLRMAASLRGIKRILGKVFGVCVSHETVRQWVLAAGALQEPHGFSTETWHIDETYIKVKGIGHWLWIVRCRESGDVIAWHLSATRLLKDAMILLRKAKDCSGFRPEKIITDGLWQYPVAIYKVMGWSWNEHKRRHIIDSGIGKNAFIERLNKEIKRRVKWFGTFQALASAKAFFGLWFYHHNTLFLT